jgi:hypothetical protein
MGDPIAFALANFGQFEGPFETFFTEYEQYQRNSADWDERFGTLYGASQPGWVAVQEALADGRVLPRVGLSDPSAMLASPVAATGAVTDPETGAVVPVIPVQENIISQPVVEPFTTDQPATTEVQTPG